MIVVNNAREEIKTGIPEERKERKINLAERRIEAFRGSWLK